MNRLAWILIVGSFLFYVPFLLSQEQSFVGSEKCGACHAKAYQIWSASSHAQAYSKLPEDKKKELRCLFCHATDAREDLKGYRLLHVQCEACHGPGYAHVMQTTAARTPGAKIGGLKEPSEMICRECHTDVRSPNLKPFKYDEALQAIRHW